MPCEQDLLTWVTKWSNLEVTLEFVRESSRELPVFATRELVSVVAVPHTSICTAFAPISV